MHSYSDDRGRAPIVDIVLTVFAAVGPARLAYIVAGVVHLGRLPFAVWLAVVALFLAIDLTLFLLLLLLFDWLFTNHIWRLLWRRPWAGICNFRGRYTAKMRDGDDAIVDAELKIDQAFRKMGVSLTIGSSVCKSIAAAVVFDRFELGDDRKELVVTYSVTTFHPRATPLRECFGTLILEWLENGNVLSGTYFTDSLNGNGAPHCADGKCLRFERVR